MATKQKGLEKKDPVKELEEKLTKMLELPVEVPSVEEELQAAKQAIANAQKLKQRKLIQHCCTECGGSGIQLYHEAARAKGKKHFACFLTEDNEFCDEHGEPFTDPDKLEALKQVREKGTVK